MRLICRGSLGRVYRQRMRALALAVLFGCGRLAFDPTVGGTSPDGGVPVGGVCATDVDCTSHAACIAQSTCACASGFAPDGVGGCAWSGGLVADPGLANPATWTIDGAAIDGAVSETGMRDPGQAQFSGCALSRITQSVTMPRLAQAGPLVLDITYRYIDPMGPAFGTTAVVGLGPVWIDDLPTPFGPWLTMRRCLGAGQYAPASSTGTGAPVLLQLAPGASGPDCGLPGVELDVDHVDVVQANVGECPDVGVAANGDAETTGGWNLSAGTTSVAAIVDGIGANGSRGVRLYLAQRCDGPAASVPVSIPTADALASPAFELYDKTTSGFTPSVSLGGRRLAIAPGSGAARTTRACVPATMRGGVFTLSAYLDGGSGTCGDPLGDETILDDVVLVDDPRCGTDPAITDAGFESRLPLLDAFSVPSKGVAQIQNAVVHSGTAALRLDASVTCYGGTWAANVVAPASQATAGPALTFFYRADAANKTRFQAIGTGTTFTGTADATWRQGVVCLRPSFGGRTQRVSFTRSFLGGTCEQAMATEVAYVDDLVLTTDPSCPP